MPPPALPCINVRDHGATGDGVTRDTAAINAAIRACAAAGGGTVFVPPGTYLIGTVDLCSHLTLHLEPGAVLKGSPDLADYRVLPFASELRNTTLLFARDAENVSIVGRGVIDGNVAAYGIFDQADTYRDFSASHTRQGEAYCVVNDSPEHGPVKHKPRPGILVLFLNCREVTVRDIRLIEAPNWCLHVACCADVLLTGLEIKSSLLMPNAGGLDVSLTRNVRISDCNISSGDDAIAFSPCADGFGTGQAENIVVDNCVLLGRSAAIRIGWGKHDFRNLIFSNIVIRESNRGILINLRRAERMENISFSNIVIETRLYKGKWWGKAEPIHISAVAEFENDRSRRVLRNVSFRDIMIDGEQGCVLLADEFSTVEQITFDNVRLRMRRGELQESFGGNFDLRPICQPERMVYKHEIPAFHASGVKALVLRNVAVEWEPGLPDYFTQAINVDSFTDLVIDGFRGGPAHASSAIRLTRGRSARVADVVLTTGTESGLVATDVTDLREEPPRVI